jgi:hypothetical protein
VGAQELYQWVLRQAVASETLGMGETAEVRYISRERLTDILFDQTYEADFNPKHMVAQGTDKTNDGKVKVLAIGAFDTDTNITLSNMLAEEKVVLKHTALQQDLLI